MTKVWNYVVLMTGISILLALGGINISGITDLLNKVGLTLDSSGIEKLASDSSLWTKVFGTGGILVAFGLGGAITIGTYYVTKDIRISMIPLFTGILFYWSSVMVSIVNATKDLPIFGLISAIIFVILGVGFILSCIEWIAGNDN